MKIWPNRKRASSVILNIFIYFLTVFVCGFHNILWPLSSRLSCTVLLQSSLMPTLSGAFYCPPGAHARRLHSSVWSIFFACATTDAWNNIVNRGTSTSSLNTKDVQQNNVFHLQVPSRGFLTPFLLRAPEKKLASIGGRVGEVKSRGAWVLWDPVNSEKIWTFYSVRCCFCYAVMPHLRGRRRLSGGKFGRFF